MEIKSVGIVGAGQMGNGIAHVFALAGYDVTMTDISQDRIKSMRVSPRFSGYGAEKHLFGIGL